jgi:hypothetical protein
VPFLAAFKLRTIKAVQNILPVKVALILSNTHFKPQPKPNREMWWLPQLYPMLLTPIPIRQFELYALSLPRGPNFEPFAISSVARSVDHRGGQLGQT